MPRTPTPWWREDRQAWFVQINRKRHNLGKDKKQAWKRYHELMARPEKRAVPSDSLPAIVDAFLEWVSKNRAPDTYEWYRYRLQRFVEHYPNLRASDVRPFHVETWADKYPGAVTSRRNYLRSVKRCLKWAKRQGYIDINPIADLEVPSGEAKEVVISEEEFAAFMSFVRNPALVDLMTVTWETGCRPQESLRVEARHVDIENQRWVFQKSEAKTKKNTRVVYLTEKALAITKRLMLAHPEGPLFRNSNGKPWTTEAVNCGFLSVQMRMGKAEMKKRGESISEEAIKEFIPSLKAQKTVKGVTRDKRPAELRSEAKQKLTHKRGAELSPRFSLYALRHSWATHALQNGIDALTVAILMGHRDPSILAKVYQHLAFNPEHMLKQARRAAG